MNKVTIKDIAKLAGVSKATVSRVINKSKYVSPEIYERVMKVIEEKEYKPSSIARSLVSKETKAIGLLIPDISNPFYSELVKGMVEVSNKSDYNILLCNSFFKTDKEAEFLRILAEKEVDGIVFMTNEITEKHKEFFKKYNKPTVTVNRKFWGFEIPNVDIDNKRAAYDATKYLIELNHKRIAIIRAPSEDETSEDRFEGYKRALEDNGIRFDECLVREGNLKANTGYKAMEQLLGLDCPPTAVFCVNDEMACGAVRCIIEKGFKVPEDISVVGFDDIPLASLFIPSITTISQPIFKMGALAMELILRMIKGEDVEVKTYVLPHKLIIRQSTKEKIN